MIGASQFREDQQLFARYFCNLRRGTYVEIGANDGMTASNTLQFERHFQWSGVLIEAGPDNIPKLLQSRPSNTIIPEAVCPKQGTLAFFTGGLGGGAVETL